jgi:hypothetical protein
MVWAKDSNQVSEKDKENGPFLIVTEGKLSIMEKESKLMDIIQFISQEKDHNISISTI